MSGNRPPTVPSGENHRPPMARRAPRIGLRLCLLYHCFCPILVVLRIEPVQLWPLLNRLAMFSEVRHCDSHPRSIQEGYKEGIKKTLCFFLTVLREGPV